DEVPRLDAVDEHLAVDALVVGVDAGDLRQRLLDVLADLLGAELDGAELVGLELRRANGQPVAADAALALDEPGEDALELDVQLLLLGADLVEERLLGDDDEGEALLGAAALSGLALGVGVEVVVGGLDPHLHAVAALRLALLGHEAGRQPGAAGELRA